MADFRNETPFGALTMPSSDRDGVDLLLIVAAAQFELPEPGYDNPRLRLLKPQEPPPMVEDYLGEPGKSSIRRDGQSPYTKPATDVHVAGDACAPKGQPISRMDVSVRVGRCAVNLRVHGDRVWQRAVTLGVTPSSAESFVRMPLIWERAYGGTATASTEQRPIFEPRNPVGCGFETDVDAAIGRPVPNIEDPRHPLRSVSDRPQPMGVGPIARHWQPRANYAGTYDDAWRRHRMPLWPLNLDERFFCSAPSYLQASPHLTGGEVVHLQGLHPDGAIEFRLPVLRLASRSRFLSHEEDRDLVLDGVSIETNTQRLTMYYRAVVSAPLSLIKHRETSLHLLTNGQNGILE